METEAIRTAAIAARNDEYRRHGLSFTITQGIQDGIDVLGLIEAVRWFTDFTDDNDPYEEHDFGKLEWYGETVFWKIDYYDQQLQHWCDPLDTACHRILTIMLAEEY